MKDIKLLIAISIVAIVWGTTFLGIRVAVETIPGWFVAGIRQFIAGIIMFILLLYKKELKWKSIPKERKDLVYPCSSK